MILIFHLKNIIKLLIAVNSIEFIARKLCERIASGSIRLLDKVSWCQPWFGGYLMAYSTLPFRWKASPYIYQTIGMCETIFKESFSSEYFIH